MVIIQRGKLEANVGVLHWERMTRRWLTWK